MNEYADDFISGLSGKSLYSVNANAAELPDGLVLVHAMSGFIDAGSAGRIAAEHLLESLDHERVITFDHDLLVDYRSRRPVMTFEDSKWTSYEEPVLAVDVVWDTTGTPFLLLHGAEPDVGWERFVNAIRDAIDALGVSLTVRLHGVPMSVPHTRPLVIGAHGSETDLIGEGLPWINSVQMPGSAAALLELRLTEAGYPAIGLVAQVPHYLAQSNYPQAAVGLLEVLQRSCDLSLPIGDLNVRAGRTSKEIERQLSTNAEAREVVSALERQYDSATHSAKLPSLLAAEEEIPTADELGAEFERFLMHEAQRQTRGADLNERGEDLNDSGADLNERGAGEEDMGENFDRDQLAGRDQVDGPDQLDSSDQVDSPDQLEDDDFGGEDFGDDTGEASVS